MIASPRKTDLGQEELRQRTRKLSQRHRTMLLLVDGRRSRIEVIDLAQKAGCAPGQFDELLAMGMVEEPSVPTGTAPLLDAEFAVAAAPEPDDERVEIEIAPPFTDTPSEGLQPLLAEPPPLLTAEAAAELPAALPAVAEPLPAKPAPVPLAPALPLAESAPADQVEPVQAVAPAAPSDERRQADQPVPVERRAARAEVALSQPVETTPPERRAAPVMLVDLPTPAGAEVVQAAAADCIPLSRNPEQRLLAEVRDLLVGMLRVDNPLSGSLLALRVGRAKTREELIALVWEIEHGLARSRRPREALGRLERARDLLGLGNTLVAEDTSFGQGSQW